jgi:glycosyltransferase involved in cell wall biosynthesis
MEQPLVSVIIPTYNRAHLIGQTLDSVLAQTYQNWECIVVDDSSTDHTEEVISNYLKQDLRFQYHSRPHDRPKGANACRNYGFELSKGDYIQYLDSDDLLSKNKIESQIQRLQKENTSDIAYCKWEKFIEMNKSYDINDKAFYRDFSSGYAFLESLGLYKTFMASHAYLFHRSILKSTGLWNEYLSSNQDGEFFSRVLMKCKKVCFCESTVFYRVNAVSSVSSYSSLVKIDQVISSWILIENKMKLEYGDVPFLYVQNAKKRVFIDLNKSNFFNIKYHFEDFFKDQLVEEKRYLKSKRLYSRILKKLKHFFI